MAKMEADAMNPRAAAQPRTRHRQQGNIGGLIGVGMVLLVAVGALVGAAATAGVGGLAWLLLGEKSEPAAVAAEADGPWAMLRCTQSEDERRRIAQARTEAAVAVQPGVWRATSQSLAQGGEAHSDYTMALDAGGTGRFTMSSRLANGRAIELSEPVLWTVQGRVLTLDFRVSTPAGQSCSFVVREASDEAIVTPEATFERIEPAGRPAAELGLRTSVHRQRWGALTS